MANLIGPVTPGEATAATASGNTTALSSTATTSAPGTVSVSPGAGAAHGVLISIAVLVGVAYAAQGAAEANPAMHELVIWMLVGVMFLLGLKVVTASGSAATDLSRYPLL